MNITVLTNSDLASNLALNRLLPALAGRHAVRVFLSGQVGGSRPAHPDLAMLKFLEQTLFTGLLFPALGDAGPAPAGNQGRRLGFAGLARAFDVPIAPLQQVNQPEGLAALDAGEPDLVISIRYGGILREPAIAIPRLGVINLHSGLLPDYRGVMATFRAMAEGATEIGTTLHTIVDAGIDTGDVIATTRQPLDPGATYLGNVLSLYPAGCDRLLDAVATLAGGGTLPTTPQPPGGNYYTFPDTADFRHFYARGCRLYDVDEVTAIARSYLDDT